MAFSGSYVNYRLAAAVMTRTDSRACQLQKLNESRVLLTWKLKLGHSERRKRLPVPAFVLDFRQRPVLLLSSTQHVDCYRVWISDDMGGEHAVPFRSHDYILSLLACLSSVENVGLPLVFFFVCHLMFFFHRWQLR